MSERSRESRRASQFARSLWWATIVNLTVVGYLVGVALIAALTHIIGSLLESLGVSGTAVTVGRLIFWTAEIVTAGILAAEALISEYRAAVERLSTDDEAP